MIVVTGGAGFIGSNLVRALNDRGRSDIVLVDCLDNGNLPNVNDLSIADFLHKDEFLRRVKAGDFGAIEGILHQGACSDTMETDGDYVMANNYEYTKALYEYCRERNIRLVYASSASVYGDGTSFREEIDCEKPLNLYGYSKWMFDQYLRQREQDPSGVAVGLRYFNVYGPHEQHKGRMASVVLHFCRQLEDMGRVKLFEGSGGYGPGEQRRDFVSIDDIVDVNLHFLGDASGGIFNVGTGRSRSFNAMAAAVVDAWRVAKGQHSEQPAKDLIDYIDFPEALVGRYQSFTEADLTQLRQSGFEQPPVELEAGVARYVNWLVEQQAHTV